MSDLQQYKKEKATPARVALTLDKVMMDKLDTLCRAHGFEKGTTLIYALINQAYDDIRGKKEG